MMSDDLDIGGPPEPAEYIGPLTQLENLVEVWRGHIATHDPQEPFTRAVDACARQLAETIERMLSGA